MDAVRRSNKSGHSGRRRKIRVENDALETLLPPLATLSRASPAKPMAAVQKPPQLQKAKD